MLLWFTRIFFVLDIDIIFSFTFFFMSMWDKILNESKRWDLLKSIFYHSSISTYMIGGASWISSFLMSISLSKPLHSTAVKLCSWSSAESTISSFIFTTPWEVIKYVSCSETKINIFDFVLRIHWICLYYTRTLHSFWILY